MQSIKNLKTTEPLRVPVTDELIVHLSPHVEHDWTMTTKEVAEAYGVTPEIVRNHKTKNADEFEEGRHYFPCVYFLHSGKNGNQLPTKQIMWTKRGVARLGFFIKSGRAKLVRDWAEDYLVGEPSPQKLMAIDMAFPKEIPMIDGNADMAQVKKILQKAITVSVTAQRLSDATKIKKSLINDVNRTGLRTNMRFATAKFIWDACYSYLQNNGNSPELNSSVFYTLLKVKEMDVRIELYEQLKKGGQL